MIQIPKRQLEVFFLTLKGTEGVLSLKDARVRDSFMKPLIEATQTFESDRRAIYVKFCDKDEEGNPNITNDEFKFKKDVVEEMGKELETLMDEEVVFTIPEGLKEIMDQSAYKPKVGESMIIDEILEKL